MTARNALTVVGIALLLAIIALACWEVWLRGRGAEPHLRVTEERWALARHRLESDTSPNAVALLGASRTRSGISHQMLQDELGATAVQTWAMFAQQSVVWLRRRFTSTNDLWNRAPTTNGR